MSARMNSRVHLLALAAAATMLSAMPAGHADAQTFPTRNLRFIGIATPATWLPEPSQQPPAARAAAVTYCAGTT